jgi:hypothetical protein
MVILTRLALVALVLAIGCTSTRAIPMGDIYRNGQLKGVYHITTRDGRSVVTDRAAAEDSAIVVTAVLVGGKRTRIPSLSIRYEDISAITRKQTNVVTTVTVCVSIVAVVWGIGLFLGSIGPIAP